MRLSSFSRRSCSSTSPQSPAICRTRYAMGSSPDASNAARAPGVATIEPGLNLIPLTCLLSPMQLGTSPQEPPQLLPGPTSSSDRVAVNETELFLGRTARELEQP